MDGFGGSLGCPSEISISISENGKDHDGGDDTKVQTPYTLTERVGLDEIISPNVLRGTLGELLGTAVLVFVIDTIVISTFQSNIGMPILVLAVLVGISVGIVLLALFPISGGHCNPVITLSAALVGLISLSRAFMYILAQCIGSVLGTLALKAVVSAAIADQFALGGCTITIITNGQDGPIETGLGLGQAFWMETFCTFSILLTAVGIGFNPQHMKSLGIVRLVSIIGIVLALLIFASATVTGKKGYAGAGMNPAKCFGPALVKGGHLWDGHWVFWAGPTIACFGYYFYAKVVSDEEFHVRGRKYDFLEVIKAFIRHFRRR